MAYQPHKFIDLQISTFRGVAEDIDIPLLSKNPTDVIKAGDEILCCLELDTEGTIATCADVTANVSVSRNGYITNDTAPTSDIWRGLLFWHRLNDADPGYRIGPLALKCAVVAGAAANTNIAVTGIAMDDTILGCLHASVTGTIATVDDIAHQISITSAGNVQTTIDTSSDTLWIFYHDSDGTAYESPSLQFSLLDGTTATTNIAVSGATTSDVVVFVGHISTKASVNSLADLTSEGSFTSAGQFQMASTDTSNDQLFVIWLDVAA